MGVRETVHTTPKQGEYGVRETVHTTPEIRRIKGLEKQFIPALNKGSMGVRETVHTTPKQGEYGG